MISDQYPTTHEEDLNRRCMGAQREYLRLIAPFSAVEAERFLMQGCKTFVICADGTIEGEQYVASPQYEEVQRTIFNQVVEHFLIPAELVTNQLGQGGSMKGQDPTDSA